jgi:anti-sigma factor RsiW
MRRQVGERVKKVTSADLQDFIEGRLPADRERAVIEYLKHNPSEARRVEALRHQAVRLRQLGSDMLSEPVPAQLLDVLNKLRN